MSQHKRDALQPSGRMSWSGPLFVVGPSRSGTAMLRSILNSHSVIKLAGETHFFDDLRARKGLLGKSSLSRDESAMCADYFRALDDRPYGMKGDPSRSPLSQAELTERAVAAGGGVDGYFEAYCRAVAERDSKRIWGEKTPRHIFRLKEILSRYPSARVICMVRDPRAVVASYRDWRNQGGLNPDLDEDYSQAMKEEEHRTRLSYNILIATLLWRAAVNSAMSSRIEFDERVKLVRYEDVIEDPARAVRELCEWLGLGYEGGMLDIPMHNSSFSAYSPGAGVSRTALERWRTTLSPREIGIVQRAAGRLLVDAGYEKDSVRPNTGGYVMEWLRLPAAAFRAVLANRDRTGNLFVYMWRRIRHAFRR